MSKEPEDLEAIERRAVPRAPVPGLTVEGVDAPLAQVRFQVAEFSFESFFLEGEAVAHFVVDKPYRLRICHGDRAALCAALCVRRESAPRQGVAFRLLPDETEARALLAELPKPAAVPRDAD
jgi:hypothetical protein